MEKENDNLALEETLQILNTMAMDYYEMGLPELSEKIWQVLSKKRYDYYQLQKKKHAELLPKRIFALFQSTFKKQWQG